MTDLRAYLLTKYRHLQNQYNLKKNTLHGSFAIYLSLIIGMIVSALGVVATLAGFLNSVDYELSSYMENDLQARARELRHYYDNLAAHNMAFSQQLTENIMHSLKKHNVKLSDLTNNLELLATINNDNYEIVENNLRHNSCSGAFYLLNQTVNDKNPKRTYSGIYLKYAYMYSDNMVANDWFMFRGDFKVAQEHNLELFNTWQMELNLDAFPEALDWLKVSHQPLGKSLLLTSPVRLLDTWERVRLLLLPIYDGNGNNIGLCGYEISNGYYQLRSQLSYYNGNALIAGVLEDEGNGRYTGQFNNDNAVGNEPLHLQENGDYTLLYNERGAFVAKTMVVEMANKKFLLATMIPESVYSNIRQKAYYKLVTIFFMILVFFFGAYRFFAKKYIDPLVGDLQQLGDQKTEGPASGFEEIENVYHTVRQNSQEQENRLRQQEEMLAQLDSERAVAKQNYDLTVTNLSDINHKQKLLLDQYNQLLDELQKREDELRVLQQEKVDAEAKYQQASTSLDNILKKQWESVDKDAYETFEQGVTLLTPKELEVYELYVQGLTPKEIVQKLFITDNTLKFHNRNIYGKLGVRTRKELLRGIEFWKLNQKK